MTMPCCSHAKWRRKARKLETEVIGVHRYLRWDMVEISPLKLPLDTFVLPVDYHVFNTRNL